ncbi:MAG: rRNA methyltransferase [Cellvibrionaceae bacterium]|nr:rRNA methyltransferase [Cellvibrionaceae bacterium]|tara:strand:+ start:38370 stop:39098 length:729 start_codon:yes stop_codon:yes gene_type:complete
MKLDDIKKLHQKKYRNEYGHFLVEGEHLILELDKAAKANPLLAEATVYASDGFGEIATSFEPVRISNKRMQAISDTKSPQGIVAVVPLEAVLTSDKKPEKERTVFLHEVQDPGNLGTILRTLAWFGNFRCVLSPNSVDPFNPKVVRASMGAIFHLPIEIDLSLEDLSNRFEKFACLDIEGEALSSTSFTEHQCFVFGNEARGVPHEQLADLNTQAYSIQGNGVLESLNLATAVNMCAYELNR